MLPLRPIPIPAVHDEFSYLLAADTFAHGRLTNPTPQFWQYFETYHVLLHPTYMSKYPPGQGLLLAAGQVLLHLPFAAVMLACAFSCVALYWALIAMMPPRWAFLGGLIAVIELSWLGYWDDSYYGGALATVGGCLFLGAWLRLRQRVSVLNASILAFSLFILAISRPYEGFLLAVVGLSSLLFVVVKMPSRAVLPQALAVFLLILAGSGTWLAYYNSRVTGHPLELPYTEFHRQCETTPLFVFQHESRLSQCYATDQKNRNEEVNRSNYISKRTPKGFLQVSIARTFGTWAFCGGAALALAPLGWILYWRNPQLRQMLLLLALMFVGWEAETYSEPHYYAPAVAIMYAAGLIGLRALYCWKRKNRWGQSLVLASLLSFGFAAILDLTAQGPMRKMLGIPPDYFNDIMQSRAAVIAALESIPGEHLVLVHYPHGHDVNKEWVYNGSDIPSERIIWAHDLDPIDPDTPLICHYRDRHVWRLSPVDMQAWTTSQAQRELHEVDTAQLCGPGGRDHAELGSGTGTGESPKSVK